VLLVHGGGWQAGDKQFYAPMARDLAAHGYVAFSINYRLLPTYRYPAELDDAQRAVRFVRAHAADYDLEPTRLGALGDSAGGYLVALLGTRETRDNSDPDLAKYSSKVQCVVDFYGPADFTVPPNSPDLSPLAIQIVMSFLGKSPTDAPDLYKESSPVTHVDKDSAPFLLIHGTKDSLVPVGQSERLYEALKVANVDVALLLAYKFGHGFLNPANPTSYGAVSQEFFNRILKP
jgi:acetyl esterase/lipase